jgi:hypothetical protein
MFAAAHDGGRSDCVAVGLQLINERGRALVDVVGEAIVVATGDVNGDETVAHGVLQKRETRRGSLRPGAVRRID